MSLRLRDSSSLRAFGVRWLVAAACIVLVVDAGAALFTALSNRSSDRARGAVTTGLAYLQYTSDLTLAILNAEAGERGYLLTGEHRYVLQYRDAVAIAPMLLNEVRDGDRGDPALQADAQRLTALIGQDFNELGAAVAAPFRGRAGLADARRESNHGAQLTNAIVAQTVAMRQRSETLLNGARRASNDDSTLSSWTAFVAYVASALLLVMMAILLRRFATVERERRAASLAQLEAERVSEAKTGFLSRVSHELRTPLNAILGFGQLLERQQLDARQHETVNQMLAGGRHLLGIVDDLLDLSRVDSGELRLSIEPVQIAETVREAKALAKPMAASNTVDLRLAAIGDDVFVQADRQRLRQVLLNVISNAIKYNRPGGDVSINVGAADSGDIRIEVADTGIGIAAADLPRLFTPFERLDAASRGIEGTGLGLAVARGLVDAMHGRLGLHSRPGIGTTVWIELPAAAAPAQELRPSAGQSPSRVRHGSGPVTVLYIEDNPSNSKLVERILALREGAELIVAMDGSSGLALARERQPSVILLDLHLPDMMGDEVLKRLLSSSATAKIPVVIVSADASVNQVNRLREAGAAGYLTKPFDVDQLLEAVEIRGAPSSPGPGDQRLEAGRTDAGLLDRRVVASLHALGANANVGGPQIGQLLRMFLEDADETLAKLRSSLEEHDLDSVAEAAHRLGGGWATFGAGEFRHLCRELERSAKVGAEADVRRLDGTIDELLGQTREALESEFVEELNAPAAPVRQKIAS
jgi:signal transduction histidine kinase/CheY-like chemotaxis protein/HPt (histidine-containing phosphotransfer) domain-containing protein